MAEHIAAIIPHLAVKNASAAIEFYKKSLGFKEIRRTPAPDGRILHCELAFNGQPLMLSDVFPEMGSGGCRSPQDLGGSCVIIHLQVTDIDAAFAKALVGGAKATMPPADMFWGDRYGQFVDPFGHHWSMATHKEDVSPAEANKRADAMFAKKPDKR
jgi:PhnB protein